jgi:hypothetical protein
MDAKIDVFDAACDPSTALLLRGAYTSHVLETEVAQREHEVRELYGSEGSEAAWRTNLTEEEQKQFVSELSLLRAQVNANVSVFFEEDDGPWVGGTLPSEDRKRLAAELAVVRQRTLQEQSVAEHLREVGRLVEGEIEVMPMYLTADPFAPGFFECEPDAWVVSGGDEPSTQVTSRAELDREVEERRARISAR